MTTSRFLVFKEFEHSRHCALPFSERAGGYTDAMSRLSQLIEHAGLQKKLVDAERELLSEDEQKLQELQSKTRRYEAYSQGQARRRQELRDRLKRIDDSKSLSEQEKKDERSAAVAELEGFERMLFEVLMD